MEKKLHRSCEKEVDEFLPSLPCDILINVFTRLPPRNVIQLSTACKHWSNLITKLDFVRNYARRRGRPGYIFQVRPDLEQTTSVVALFHDVEMRAERDLLLGPRPVFYIHDSFNGFLLLERRTGRLLGSESLQCCSLIMVYDPTTRRSKYLPPLHSYESLWSLACDSRGQRYKVVRAFITREGEPRCVVHSLERGWGKWREVKPPQRLQFMMARLVFAGGYLHWMVGVNTIGIELHCTSRLKTLDGRRAEPKGYLLTMDVGSEVFYQTVHPECATGIYNLLEVNGGLCFVDHLSSTRLRVWALKEFGRQEWVAKCEIDLGCLGKLPLDGFLEGTFARDIYEDDKSRMIIFQNRFEQLFCYNLELQRIEKIGVHIDKSWHRDYINFMASPIRHIPSWDI